MLTAARPVEREIGFYPPRILLVLGGHLCTVFFHHVAFQIYGGIEDDEFTSKAVRLSAGVMGGIEVFILHQSNIGI